MSLVEDRLGMLRNRIRTDFVLAEEVGPYLTTDFVEQGGGVVATLPDGRYLRINDDGLVFGSSRWTGTKRVPFG